MQRADSVLGQLVDVDLVLYGAGFGSATRRNISCCRVFLSSLARGILWWCVIKSRKFVFCARVYFDLKRRN